MELVNPDTGVTNCTDIPESGVRVFERDVVLLVEPDNLSDKSFLGVVSRLESRSSLTANALLSLNHRAAETQTCAFCLGYSQNHLRNHQ